MSAYSSFQSLSRANDSTADRLSPLSSQIARRRSRVDSDTVTCNLLLFAILRPPFSWLYSIIHVLPHVSSIIASLITAVTCDEAQSTKHPWGGVVVPPHFSASKTTRWRCPGSIKWCPPFRRRVPSGAWVLPCAWGPPWAGVLPALRGFGAASLPPLGYRAPAPPRGRSACRGVALRGRGFGFESGSLGNLDTTSNPTADALCDRVRVSGISTVAPLPLMACGP